MSHFRPASATLMALALLLVGCESSTRTTITATAPTAATTSAPAEAGPTPVIVDYSPTVSDVGGLLYLLSHPDVEVIAISLPATGEAGCDLGVEVTLGILAMVDREDIPVACDPEVAEAAKEWPEDFLAGHENLRFGLPDSTATASELSGPDLIARAAAESERPVVLYAVAPLTNVARALDRYPDLAGDLDRIVIMGGAVDAPGNVFGANAEWNVWIDVPAAAYVVASGVPITFVPLDATNAVPVPSYYQRLLEQADQSDAVVYLSNLVRTFPAVNSGFWYFWDELAASVVAGENRVPTEEMEIVVVEGGIDDGRTAAVDGGYPTTVGVGVLQTEAFYDHFVETLAGVPLVEREATPEEEAYLRAVAAATSHLEETFESVFDDPAFNAAFDEAGGEYDPVGVSASFDRFLTALTVSYEGVVVLEPPASLRDEHFNFLAIFSVFTESRDDLVTAAAEATSIDEFFQSAPIQFPDVNEACQPMAEAAFFLGVDVEIVCNPRL